MIHDINLARCRVELHSARKCAGGNSSDRTAALVNHGQLCVTNASDVDRGRSFVYGHGPLVYSDWNFCGNGTVVAQNLELIFLVTQQVDLAKLRICGNHIERAEFELRSGLGLSVNYSHRVAKLI